MSTNGDVVTPVTGVLLLVGNRGNRRVLADWVRRSDGYHLVENEDSELLPPFDVCIADAPGMDGLADRLRDARTRQQSFQPCLFVESKRTPFERLGPVASDVVDEVVTAPIDPNHLRFRIDQLARRRRLSADLSASKERYRRLFDFAPDAKFIVADGAIREANRAAGRLLDAEPAALVGTDLADHVVHEDRDRLRDVLADAPSDVGGDTPAFVGVAFDRPTGETLCEVTAVQTGASGDRLVLARDVTEQVGRQRRLAVLDRVLRHNVRNQMNVALGYAEALCGHDDPEVRAMAERIRRASDNLLKQSEAARAFRDVVTSDRPEVGVYDLCTIAEAAVAEVVAAHPDVTFETELPLVAPVWADEGVSLAVGELVENAAEHGGQPVVVRVEVDGERTTLSVSDGGSGIPSGERPALEDDEERPTQHAGGIGLWLVRWTVERVEGQVTVPDDDAATVRLHFRTADGA